MKFYLGIFLFLLSVTLEAKEHGREFNCEITKCRDKNCGCDLLKQGWKEIANCDGHQWFYVLEKKDKRMKCSGIAARDGLSENECTPFKESLAEFKKCK
ncbi:MAG: hypothetical protein M9962_14620 [Oligoflexia bacterium]|nr:hypothetical protein [Oligoflexia bacterium]